MIDKIAKIDTPNEALCEVGISVIKGQWWMVLTMQFLAIPYIVISLDNAGFGFFDYLSFLLQIIVTLAIPFFTFTLWRAAVGANKIADKSRKTSLRPVLTVEMPEIESLEELFNQQELMFEIRNVGNGPAFLTELFRCWDARQGGMPQKVPPTTKPKPGIWKTNLVAIGAGRTSGKIKTRKSILRSRADPSGKQRIFFYGYMRYKDLDGNKYVSGFCQYFYTKDVKTGFHFPWPKDEADGYNYHKEEKIDH